MMNDIIPLAGIIFAVGLPIATALILGMLWIKGRHAERMGLINQGIIPPDTPKKKSDPNPLVSLKIGIILIALGIGFLIPGLLFVDNMEFCLFVASIAFFLGVGYLVHFLVVQKISANRLKEEEEQE
jgi:hypothetical protein